MKKIYVRQLPTENQQSSLFEPDGSLIRLDNMAVFGNDRISCQELAFINDVRRAINKGSIVRFINRGFYDNDHGFSNMRDVIQMM